MGLAYSYYSALIDCIPIRIQYRSFFFNQYFFFKYNKNKPQLIKRMESYAGKIPRLIVV
jgi:hypothetical protein